MLGKLNKLKEEMSKLSDIKKSLEDVDMTDPKAMMESFGIDYDELEKSFTHNGFEPTEIQYSLKSVNKEPQYHYGSDSGFDLRANEKVVLGPFERSLVPTGLHIDVPKRCEVQVRPKSGLALKKGLTVLNTPGTVDEGYTGEIKVILINLGEKKFIIEKGLRIAQMVLCPVIKAELEEVDELDETKRGSGGFGSTGIK